MNTIKPNLNLIQHRIIRSSEDSLHPQGQLYDFLYGGNGCFISAERPGIHALIQKATYDAPELHRIAPFIQTEFPRVPAGVMQEVISLFAENAQTEALVYLLFQNNQWELFQPPQEQKRLSVKPRTAADRANAVIEIHSHHRMEPVFSSHDDEAETAFRFYSVIGCFPNPCINTRVGIYGHFYNIESDTIFVLPDNLRLW